MTVRDCLNPHTKATHLAMLARASYLDCATGPIVTEVTAMTGDECREVLFSLAWLAGLLAEAAPPEQRHKIIDTLLHTPYERITFTGGHPEDTP